MFWHPTDSNYNTYIPADYKMTLNVDGSYETGYADKIEITSSNQSENAIIAAVTNKSGKKLGMIHLSALMYDASGNLVGVNEAYADCNSAGSTDYVNFYYMNDDNYDPIVPANYQIYVDFAYAY